MKNNNKKREIRAIRETKEYGKNNTIAILVDNTSNTIRNTNIMVITKMVMDD